ncbi:MAG TPA: hypothetical protein VN905_13635 [Candidatus Binatia bacterium]|nr:hypothetical protein [Candidatus Binatia bacterium]
MTFKLLSGALFALALSFLSAFAVVAQPAPALAPGAAATSSPPAAAPEATPTVNPYVMPTAAPFSRVNLDADSIDFYWNRYVIEANGHVRVQMSDGTLVTGDTFSTDLRLNRFLVAGHVHIAAKDVQYDGAAFAENMDDGRGYFLPVFDEPDRWTFLSGNYAVPYLGREIPYDAFMFPDTNGTAVFLNATAAVIWPRDALLFKGTEVHVLGFKAPGGQIYFNFSNNINFRQNSLVGAAADVGYPFAGGRWWYSTLHLRYDGGPNNIGTYGAFEQHFAWDNAYAVASVNPFTQFSKQYNLLASTKIGPKFQLDTFQQINLSQYGWTTPANAAWFGSFTATTALHNSFTKVVYNTYAASIANSVPPVDPDHPSSVELDWIGFDHRIGLFPLTFRLRSGGAVYNDTYGLGSFAGTPYTNLWSTWLGGTLYTTSIKLFKDTYLVGSFDMQRTFYSLPHYLNTTTTTGSISRLIGTKAAFSVTYQNVNAGDYAGSQKLAIYPPSTPVNPATGLPDTGYAAFRGLATSRTMSYLLSYTPRPAMALSLNYQHYTDFPPPIGVISGRPPNYFNADLKVRLTPQLSVEVGRPYYFNWYGAKWAPYMLIQFGP